MEKLKFFIPEEFTKEKLKITQKFFEVFKLIDIAKVITDKTWLEEIFKDVNKDLEIKIEMKKDEFLVNINCNEDIKNKIAEEIVNSLFFMLSLVVEETEEILKEKFKKNKDIKKTLKETSEIVLEDNINKLKERLFEEKTIEFIKRAV